MHSVSRADGKMLLLCMTPLHVLTAGAIARERGKRFACGVYAAVSDDEKSREYCERMKQFCEKVHFYKMQNVVKLGLSKYLDILRARKSYLRWLRSLGVHEACCLPSSLSDYVYALPSARSMQIYTYDDGVLNIHPDRLINTRDRACRTKLLLLLSGIKYWPSRIMNETRCHYTLYDIDNIYPRTKRISLFDAGSRGGLVGEIDNEKRYSLVLGPSPEFDAEAIRILEGSCREREINGFLPHPRWRGPGPSGIDAVVTKLIAEDFVIDLLKQGYSGVDVFGLESSALINLVGVPGVRCFTFLKPGGKSDAVVQLMVKAGVELVEK